jgi:hypothetical protein
VDLERGLLFLADSKTGRRTVILNAPALAVLTGLDRLGSYVVPAEDPEKPRADLKRPGRRWRGALASTAFAFTIFGIPTRASGPAVALACRSSVSCWGIRRRQPRSVTHTSTPILSAVRLRRLAAGSRQHSKGSPVDRSLS